MSIPNFNFSAKPLCKHFVPPPLSSAKMVYILHEGPEPNGIHIVHHLLTFGTSFPVLSIVPDCQKGSFSSSPHFHTSIRLIAQAWSNYFHFGIVFQHILHEYKLGNWGWYMFGEEKEIELKPSKNATFLLLT